MPNPINWFEIPVTDMARAKTFYEAVFEIDIALNEMDSFTMGWFPFEQGASGATGTLMKAKDYTPSYEGTMVYFSVPEIDDVLARVEQHGGKIINKKFPIGENGFCGHFEDSEGNRVALHQGAG